MSVLRYLNSLELQKKKKKRVVRKQSDIDFEEFYSACHLPKMKATYSTETSVNFQRTIWRYISQDRTLHNHRFENLKSYYLF
jgi:hypothetical protein